jgi:F-type H+-transporting ATPase subunit epsilon
MADEHEISVEVLSPEGEIFSGDLLQVSTRTTVGEIGIRARHVPMVARLVPAELRLIDSGGDTTSYAQGEGWLEVFANHARVLVSEAVKPEDLDSSDLESRLEEAKSTIEEADEDSTEREAAEREKARAEAFLEIAKG